MKYVLDSHTHTVASGHAYSTLHEMAKEAAEKGLELLGITEHSMTMPGTCHEYYFQNMRMLPRELYGIQVMHGSEVNIIDYDGKMDMGDSLLKKMDVVIASLHIPCIRPGTLEENTRALLGAMNHPYVNIIGHPDDSRYPVDYEILVKAAKDKGVLLELNNTSLHPKSSRKDAAPNDRILLRLCKEYEVPIILGSDAHTQEDIGNHRYLDALLEETAFPENLIVNRSVDEYKKYINRYKDMMPGSKGHDFHACMKNHDIGTR
ncbi:MAG: phosphatase [Lachnospiraceae bacterium]|nr:phosphatase [Lachnospiraceae bacterium]